jgi:hypothetical protein
VFAGPAARVVANNAVFIPQPSQVLTRLNPQPAGVAVLLAEFPGEKNLNIKLSSWGKM